MHFLPHHYSQQPLVFVCCGAIHLACVSFLHYTNNMAAPGLLGESIWLVEREGDGREREGEGERERKREREREIPRLP